MAKGGTTSQSTQIPAYLEDAVRENINRARDVSQIGYVPYYGPDVAAFSPMQQQSMRSTGNAASAFGLAPEGFDGTAGIPQAQTFAGGVQGYSSAPLYEQSLDKLFANAPAQYNAMNDMFIDPFTGARSRNNYGNASPVMGMARSSVNGGGDGNGNNGYFDQVHADRMAGMNNGGEHYGVNREYNPYAGNMMTDSSGEWIDSNGDGVKDYRDMSFGEDGRRQIGMGERVGEFLLGGPSRAFDAVGRTLFDISGAGDPTMTQQEAVERMTRLSSGYNSANDVTVTQTDVNGNPLGGFQPYYQPNVGMVYVDPNLGGIQGGLLGNVTTTPLASANITGSSYDQYAQSRIAVQEAQRQQLAQARQEADIQRLLDQEDAFNAQQAAAAQEAAIEAARAAAAEQARIQRQNDRDPEPTGRNSSGNGFGASNRSGSTSSGQTDYGFF